jgi:hypothetical protein
MILRSTLIWPLAAIAVLTCAVSQSRVQSQSNGNSSYDGVVVTEVARPVYPQLAKQASVMGDVELNVVIRRDGTVESADAISGPPMLIPAALDSAKNSKFDCSRCTENLISYRLLYSFQFGPGPACANTGDTDETAKQEGYPRVTITNNHIVVCDQPPNIVCIYNSVLTPKKTRSAKCLYLWKCGHR